MTETLSSGKIALWKEYTESDSRFGRIRVEAKRLRRQLITAILQDERDVLTEQELATIISLMDRFLEVQVRLRQAKSRLSKDRPVEILVVDLGDSFVSDGSG